MSGECLAGTDAEAYCSGSLQNCSSYLCLSLCVMFTVAKSGNFSLSSSPLLSSPLSWHCDLLYFRDSVEKILIGSSSESVEVVGKKTSEEDAEELLGYAVMMEKTITVNVDGGAEKAAPSQGIFIENSNVQFSPDKPSMPMVEPVRPVAVNGVQLADAQSGKHTNGPFRPIELRMENR
jgi:hypothetical protein